MKAIASMAAVVLIAAVPLTASPVGNGPATAEDTKPAPTEQSQPWLPKAAPTEAATKDSPLVWAARAARAANAAKPKRARPLKVITNDDVRKSKGKLTELPAPAVTSPGVTGDRSLSAAGDAHSKRIDDLKKKSADLETSLNRLEDEYYDADDPAFRDDVIQKKFNETRRELEKSRALLNETQRRAEEKSSSSSAPHR